MEPLDWLTVLIRLTAASIAGGLLGLEREVQDKPAGLRTHMMVALGSAVTGLVGLQFLTQLDIDGQTNGIDPLRVVQGIVGGIGFLGAGAIIQSRDSVKGLTTAANIWLSAGVGVSCALGMFPLAATAVAVGLTILYVFGYAEQWLFERRTRGRDNISQEKSDDAGTQRGS